MSQIYDIYKEPCDQFYPTNNDFYYPNMSKNSSNIKGRNRSYMTCLLISLLLAIFIVIVTAVSCGIIFGTSNAHKTCIPNAMRINNKCVCKYGFNGDGINYCDECGVSSIKPNLGRIVGGIQAIKNSWPSAVLIIFSYKGNIKLPSLNGGKGEIVTVRLSSKCGGTLIDRSTVLTAGHCFLNKIQFTYNGQEYSVPVKPTAFYKTIESMYTVYAGLHYETDALDISKIKNSSIKAVSAVKLVRHENYNEITKQNDIAIIKLAKPIILTREIQVACLPTKSFKSYFPNDRSCWTIGWGKLVENGKDTDELYNVKLNMYNSSMCQNVAYSVPKNWDMQICAGEYNGGKDSCQGDSGGSLFVKESINNQTKYMSIGIVSYGDGCGIKKRPGIYTRTSYYINWIKDNS